MIVDDDHDYLEQLKMMLPADFNILLHLSPRAVIPVVLQNVQALVADAAKQQEIVSKDAEQRPVPGILDYWRTSPDRYGIIHTIVSDYFMPGMDGLEMLSRLGDWTGKRVLLTGQADEQVAVKAFNAGLIDKYIGKVTPELTPLVIRTLREFNLRAHPRYEHIWSGQLSASQYEILQQPDVARDLSAFVDGHWAEYMVLGEPFGILGLSNSGMPGWLQLEPAESLAVAADIAGDAGISSTDVEAIRSGKSLAAVEVGVKDRKKIVAPAAKFGGQVYGALFEPWQQLPSGGYSQWRARQPARVIV